MLLMHELLLVECVGVVASGIINLNHRLLLLLLLVLLQILFVSHANRLPILIHQLILLLLHLVRVCDGTIGLLVEDLHLIVRVILQQDFVAVLIDILRHHNCLLLKLIRHVKGDGRVVFDFALGIVHGLQHLSVAAHLLIQYELSLIWEQPSIHYSGLRLILFYKFRAGRRIKVLSLLGNIQHLLLLRHLNDGLRHMLLYLRATASIV